MVCPKEGVLFLKEEEKFPKGKRKTLKGK